VFVRQENLTAIVEKAREVLAGRETFVSFAAEVDDSELRCQLTWPGDPKRKATLSVCFFHLP
jgi:hypothetical protein